MNQMSEINCSPIYSNQENMTGSVKKRDYRLSLADKMNLLRMPICEFGYRCLSIISKPFDRFTSNYFKYRAEHISMKYDKIAYGNKGMINKFGENWIGGGINIVQKRNKETFIDSFEYQNKFQENIKNNIRKIDKNGSITVKSIPQTVNTEGICSGIMMALAVDYLDMPEGNDKRVKLEKYFVDSEKGGQLKSEMIQNVIETFDCSLSKDYFLSELDQFLFSVKSHPESSLAKTIPLSASKIFNNYETLFNDLSLVIMKDELNQKNSQEYFKSFLDRAESGRERKYFPRNLEDENRYISLYGRNTLLKMRINILSAKVLEKNGLLGVEENKNVDPTLNHFIKINNGKSTIDYAAFEKALYDEINSIFITQMENAEKHEIDFLIKKREELINEIKWGVGLQEVFFSGHVHEPILNKMFNLDMHVRKIREKAVADYYGLKMISTEEIMGSHLQFSNDAAYLKGLDKLASGFYYVGFKCSESSGHMISLIKENDGTGYIIDPNNVYLKFQNDIEAKELLIKLISRYPQPKNSIKDKKYHQVEIVKIEKKAKSS